MKMFLIFWLCVQNPTIPLEQTCIQNIVYDVTYNTKQECREASVKLAKEFTQLPNTYITTFCTTKIISQT
jgi:hypothetical protein